MTTQNALNTQLVLPSGSTAINSLLYTSAANLASGLATVNSASLVTSLTGVPTWLGPLTNGQVIIGSTGAIPVASTLTAGTNVTITNAAGSITINATGSGSGTVTSGTINQLAYYAATGTVVSGLATGNNGILVTSATGVPSIATTFGQGLAVASSQLAVGGANNIPFNNGKGIQDNNGNSLLLFTVVGSAVNNFNMANEPTGTGPVLSVVGSDTNINMIITSKGLGNISFLNNNNGNTMFAMSPVASSVNAITASPAATGNPPFIMASGSDTNIVLSLRGQGTGGVQTQGTTAGGNATAGYVGELISSVIPSASAVAIVSSTPKNLTSISLTAGDWDVYGNITFNGSLVAIATANVWISTTSATLPDLSLYNGIAVAASSTAIIYGANAPYVRISISTTTTVYISGNVVLTGGTCAMQGGIYARRVR